MLDREYEQLLNKALKTRNKTDCKKLADWFSRTECMRFWDENLQGWKLEDGHYLRVVNEKYDEETENYSCDWEID